MSSPETKPRRSPVKVSITNFQSIEKLDFEVNGFTCVTGKTNIGKSAVIRAVARSLVNSPVTGMVRHGAKFCTVELGSEGWGFKWSKGERGVNRYEIPGKKDALDKVGQVQVPEIEAMGFGNVEVGSRKIYPWYAEQFEPVFLLKDSGPSVTSFLSSISNLDELQDSIVHASRGKKRSNDEAKIHEEEVVSLRAKSAKLLELEVLESLRNDIDGQVESIKDYETRVSSMEILASGIRKSTSVAAVLEPVKEVRVPSMTITDALDQMKSMERHNRGLVEAARGIIPIRTVAEVPLPDFPIKEIDKSMRVLRLAGAPAAADAVKKLEVAAKVAIPASSDLDGDVARLKTADRLGREIRATKKLLEALEAVPLTPDPVPIPEAFRKAKERLRDMKSTESEIASLENELHSLDEQLKQVTEEYGKIPTCPTCGRVNAPCVKT